MSTTATKLPVKFGALRKAVRSRLLERDDEIEIMLLALLARTHAFFLGEPGIAKSMMIEAMIENIDGLDQNDYFHTLFMKSSTFESVFGPLDITALKEGRYRYKPEGFLPLAKVAFIDEIWKANGAILNALLWATNERLYRNDGKVETIPLHSVFCASNEMPENDELLAIYDRFPLRRQVKRIAEPGNFVNMLKIASSDAPEPTPCISWAEVEQARDEVKLVNVPEDVMEALSDIKEKLKQENIFPSDRRFGQCIRIIQAAAWLEGETEAEVEHLHPLRHVLWSDVNDIPTVESMLLAVSNPIDLEIQAIMEGLAGLSVAIDQVINDGGDDDMKERAGAEIYEKIEASKGELVEISGRLKGSKKRTGKLDAAIDQVTNLTSRLLIKVFKTTPEQIEKGLKRFKDEMALGDENE